MARAQKPRFTTINKSLSWHMKHMRTKVLNQSQERMALDLGVTRVTYASWEKGKTMPSLDKFIEICNRMYLDPSKVIDDASWKL